MNVKLEHQWAIIRACILPLSTTTNEEQLSQQFRQATIGSSGGTPGFPVSILPRRPGNEMDIDQVLESEDVEEGMDASYSSPATGGVVCSQQRSCSNPLDGLSTSDAVAYLRRQLREDNPGTRALYQKFLAALEIDAVQFDLLHLLHAFTAKYPLNVICWQLLLYPLNSVCSKNI